MLRIMFFGVVEATSENDMATEYIFLQKKTFNKAKHCSPYQKREHFKGTKSIE